MSDDRCERCDRPRFSPSVGPLDTVPRCTGRLTAGCDANAIDWRDRALAAEAERDEANEDRRLYYSQRLYLRDAESIARRALVEGLAECRRLRDVRSCESCGVVEPGGSLPPGGDYFMCPACNRSDAARAERERWAAWFDTRVAFCREQQQVAAMERQLVVADQFGRLAAEREQTAAVLRSNNIPSADHGDHAKGDSDA